jgi:hypothetical protein
LIIYNLPNDFNLPEEQDKPVIIRSYQATVNSANNKSIIHQNMVDIVIAGKKTIIDVYNITSLEPLWYFSPKMVDSAKNAHGSKSAQTSP